MYVYIHIIDICIYVCIYIYIYIYINLYNIYIIINPNLISSRKKILLKFIKH